MRFITLIRTLGLVLGLLLGMFLDGEPMQSAADQGATALAAPGAN